MGQLDYLIHSNKEPKEGMEYIYLLDMVWRPGELGDLPMEYGSIMTDVVKLENDSFEFTHKETGERYRTNYGWALAENTPENVEKINQYIESKKELEELERITNKLRNEISDLDGPSKIERTENKKEA